MLWTRYVQYGECKAQVGKLKHLSKFRVSCDYIGWTITHHAWSWIRDPAFIDPPLVVGTLFMGKRSVEGFSDVSHTINTHGKTLEHITVEERGRYTVEHVIQTKY